MKTRAEQEETVRRYYNQEVAGEEQRLAVYPSEFVVTMRLITQYLSPGDRIVDAACGTGRYAEALVAADITSGRVISPTPTCSTPATVSMPNPPGRGSFSSVKRMLWILIPMTVAPGTASCCWGPSIICRSARIG